RDRGVLVVTAAGNEASDNDRVPQFPSGFNLDNIISVAAIDRAGWRASFSNYGSTSVDLGAPGVDIYSTLSTSEATYGFASGTTMAAPYLAGVAALIWAQAPNRSVFDVRDLLLNTAEPTAGLDGLTVTGGRVNAFKALTATPTGQLKIAAKPAAGTTLFGGRSIPIVARVTDATGVTGATVAGTVNGSGALTFRDDGVSPDVTANDASYTATLAVPSGEGALSLAITAAAPEKARSARLST
ncbi:MAG TPA: S8 family serine peptidase, partial [Opitutaceae bacterium]